MEGSPEVFLQATIEAYSAGSQPSSEIDPFGVKVMKMKGIDLSTKRSKSLNDLRQLEMDYLITMGCEETCPAIPAKEIIEWEIPDPKGKSIELYREIRDIIEHKVKAFLEDIV